MAALTRVYLVRSKGATDATPGRLVRASHPAHALRHVADGEYRVEVASQDDLIALLQSGTPVETIAAEQAELPAT